jgi:hypothetical protein
MIRRIGEVALLVLGDVKRAPIGRLIERTITPERWWNHQSPPCLGSSSLSTTGAAGKASLISLMRCSEQRGPAMSL